ncbi:MAG: hypothetical protein KJZ75_11285 [Hyphomonadaceae bacterium]|nr:hypothetical protein [Hyphomonadaceae bacterium]
MAKSSRRARKPYDPAQDAEKRAKARAAEDRAMRAEGIDPKIARWGDDGMDDSRVEALERQGFAVVRADTETARNPGRSTIVVDQHRRQIKASHKADVWQQLHTRDPERFTKAMLGAVRDLQDLMARRAGLGGRDEAKAYGDVRKDEPLRDACLVSDDMLRAGVEMDLTLQLVGPPSSRLLAALLWPDVLAETHDWREIVTRLTGETHSNALAVPLRIAAQALVDVKAEVQKRLQAAGKGRAERRDPQGFGEAPVRTHPFQAGPGR